MSISVAPERSTLSLPGLRLRTDEPTLRAGPNGVSVQTAAQRAAPATVNVSRTAVADAGALKTATSGLDRATSIADTAAAAAGEVVELLGRLRDMTGPQRDAAIGPLLDQIDQAVSGAGFDGVNLLNGSMAGGLSLPANADGSGEISVGAHDLRSGGPNVSLDLGEDEAAMLASVEGSLAKAEAARDGLREDGKRVEAHRAFVGILSDAVSGGAQSLDVEGAKLAALSVKQALGGTTLALASGDTRTVLSLFR